LKAARQPPTARCCRIELRSSLLAGRYVLPEPKSKAAKWGNTDTRTTWFPGYWKNEKTDATSVSQPKKPGLVGDGQEKPKWRDGGSPGPANWVEWLCSREGAAERVARVALLRDLSGTVRNVNSAARRAAPAPQPCPSSRITSVTSLSPRPDTLMTTVWSGRIARAA
jgi:hypothetical protein